MFVPLAATPALAADVSWSDPFGGLFGDVTNWSGGAVPGASDNSIFNQGTAGYTVSFATDHTTNGLTVFNDTVFFDLGGNTYTLTDTTNPSLLLGGSGNDGYLRLENGILSAVDTSIGYFGFLPVAGSGTAVVSTGGLLQSSGELTVGDTQEGTLEVEAGGQVSSNTAYIGRQYGVTGTATVTGAGSAWTNSGDFSIGFEGDGILNVLDGGTVTSNILGSNTVLGYTGGSTGTATISGTGSLLDANYLTIAREGNATLTVENGGSVQAVETYIGPDAMASGTGIVSGTGSSLTATNGIYVESGVLDIMAGGMVSANQVGIGMGMSGSGRVDVRGAGSLLDVGSLDVGIMDDFDISSNGILYVDDGGVVRVDALYVNQLGTVVQGVVPTPGGSGAGGTSIGTGLIQAGTGSSPISEGMYIATDGYAGVVGGSINLQESMVVNGFLDAMEYGQISSGSGYIGYASGDSGIVNISMDGGWTNNVLSVGYNGAGELNINAAGTVFSNAAILGENTGADGTVMVSGLNSSWQVANLLQVGAAGTGSLTIDNEGQVYSADGYIGTNVNGDGTATVSGVGSSWTNTSDLFVGNSGTGTLNIDSGGVVTNDNGYIGNNAGSNGTVTVSGAGSSWTSTTSLQVGHRGTGVLNINSGGLVSNPNNHGHIAWGTGSSGTATVSGTGSTWTSSDLFVGTAGTGILNVNNGGSIVVTGNSTMGGSDVSVDGIGSATITGAGSTWISSGLLKVGGYGVGTLNIEAGGLVTNTLGILGSSGHSGSSVGTVMVSGSGSTWSNSSDLRVGQGGTGTLNIEAGGLVTSNDGYIGLSTGSNGTATISGAGSNWTNTGALYVGNSGAGTLNIDTGGLVSNNLGYIGYNGSSVGTVDITGAGSLWDNASALHVGYGGTGNLNINSGGAVTSGSGTIGTTTGTGTVTVDGGDWTLDPPFGFMSIGGSGTGTLDIVNGGTVSNNEAVIGSFSGSSGTVMVGGTGSTWITNSRLGIGDNFNTFTPNGTGALTINTGGTVNVGGETLLGTAGTLNLDGGTLHTGSFDSSAGTFNFNDGNLTIDGGTFDGGPDDLVLSGETSLDATTLQFINGGSYVGGGTTIIGDTNSAALLIQSGGSVLNAAGFIGWNGGTGTVTVSGTGTNWFNSGNLFVGLGGTGMLNIDSGGSVYGDSAAISVGGTVAVSGPGSNLSSVDLYVFDAGALNIDNGGSVDMSTGIIGSNGGSAGIVTISGSGSILAGSSLYVGGSTLDNGGAGVLNIDTGGSVLTDFSYIGSEFGSDGTVTVSGSGSNWDSGSLLIGWDGTGVLNISNGGLVSSSDSTISEYNSDGTVTVSGVGSSWMITNGLNVGRHGTGTLHIDNGGLVSSDFGNIGESISGSNSTVIVLGTGSSWENTGNLAISSYGTASLNIGSGGSVSSYDGIIGGAGPIVGSGAAFIDGAGSSWTISNSLFIGSEFSEDVDIGQLTVSNGGLLSVGNVLKVWNNGTLSLNGGSITTTNFNAEAGSTLNYNGGTLTVDGGTFNNGSGVSVNGTGMSTLRLINGAAVPTAGPVAIGTTAYGGLSIESGTSITSTVGNVGTGAGGNGSVTVTGIGSSWTSTDIAVGGVGTGTVNVGSAGTVTATNNLNIGSGGTVNVNAGTLNVAGTVTNLSGTETAKLTVTNGLINATSLSNGGRLEVENSTINADVTSSNSLAVTGAGGATINGDFTNTAFTKITDSSLTVTGTFTNSGIYFSDPSDNYFNDVVITEDGYMVGGVGDNFYISGDFTNNSLQNGLWNTDEASLIFNGTGIQNVVLGSEDCGIDGCAGNFNWGELHLESGASLNLFDDNGDGGALYVGLLDLADGIGQLLNINSAFPIYYDPNLAGNSYLLGQELTTAGGGSILAGTFPASVVPVPGAVWLFGSGLLGLIGMARRKKVA